MSRGRGKPTHFCKEEGLNAYEKPGSFLSGFLSGVDRNPAEAEVACQDRLKEKSLVNTLG